MKYYLVCYDISDDKIRNKVSFLLSKYLIRTQKSAFEGYLTKETLSKLSGVIEKWIDCDTDRIYFIFISNKSLKRIKRFGILQNINQYFVI